jgi:hypothetical protein
MGAWHQDWLADWLSVVLWLRLRHTALTAEQAAVTVKQFGRRGNISSSSTSSTKNVVALIAVVLEPIQVLSIMRCTSWGSRNISVVVFSHTNINILPQLVMWEPPTWVIFCRCPLLCNGLLISFHGNQQHITTQSTIFVGSASTS